MRKAMRMMTTKKTMKTRKMKKTKVKVTPQTGRGNRSLAITSCTMHDGCRPQDVHLALWSMQTKTKLEIWRRLYSDSQM